MAPSYIYSKFGTTLGTELPPGTILLIYLIEAFLFHSFYYKYERAFRKRSIFGSFSLALKPDRPSPKRNNSIYIL
jgi:hypothetical protein